LNDIAGAVDRIRAAILQRYFPIQRCRYAEHDRAFDLRPHGIRADDRAAINGADDPPDTNLASLRNFDLGDLGHVGPEDEL
jgi:hypothetical protein